MERMVESTEGLCKISKGKTIKTCGMITEETYLTVTGNNLEEVNKIFKEHMKE